MPVIAGGKLVTPRGILDEGWIGVAGSTIVAVGTGRPDGPVDVDLAGGWVVPGFVDIHSHGGGGATVVGADPGSVRTFADTHRAHGTTTIIASLVTGFYPEIERDVRALAELAQDGIVAGIHLEGPWISHGKRGAHNPEALATPDPVEVKRLLDAGAGAIRMVTLAPELDHGLDAIRTITDGGAIVAVGHTEATYDITRQAVEAGATVATHLFNAMAPIHHREPGPIVALLEDPRVSVELVCDGVHLHPAIVAHAYDSAGGSRALLVTDAMQAAGFADGTYPLGDLDVNVVGGVARLVDSGSIAGSTLTMDHAFKFAVQQSGFSMTDAVAASATNPARLLGLAEQTGALAEGLVADLVVLDADLTLRAVMAAGEWVRENPPIRE